MTKIYTKETWEDEVLAGETRYDIKDNSGTPIESNVRIDLATSVVTAGTSVDADIMNNIEDGIDALDTKLSNIEDGTASDEVNALKAWLKPYLDSFGGWASGTGTWSYVSADSPTFVMNVPDADAALMNLGSRIRLTQTTTKYFIVTAKGSPSGGFTPITMFGGTGGSAFTLVSATITAPSFSNTKSPVGFPMDKTLWRVSLTDTSDRSQASPAQGAWYNPASLSVTIPIGQWRVYWEAPLQVQVTTTTSLVAGFAGSLSTANNTETDNEFTGRYTFSLPPSTTNATGRAGVHVEKVLTLASKTVYYLIASTGAAGLASVGFVGNLAPIKIVAECAYL